MTIKQPNADNTIELEQLAKPFDVSMESGKYDTLISTNLEFLRGTVERIEKTHASEISPVDSNLMAYYEGVRDSDRSTLKPFEIQTIDGIESQIRGAKTFNLLGEVKRQISTGDIISSYSSLIELAKILPNVESVEGNQTYSPEKIVITVADVVSQIPPSRPGKPTLVNILVKDPSCLAQNVELSNEFVRELLDNYAVGASRSRKINGVNNGFSQGVISKYRYAIKKLRKELPISDIDEQSILAGLQSNYTIFESELKQINLSLEEKLSSGQNISKSLRKLLGEVGRENPLEQSQEIIEYAIGHMNSVHDLITQASRIAKVDSPVSAIDEIVIPQKPVVQKEKISYGGPLVSFESPVAEYDWKKVQTNRDEDNPLGYYDIDVPISVSVPVKEDEIRRLESINQRNKKQAMGEVKGIRARQQNDAEFTVEYLTSELNQISNQLFGVDINEDLTKHIFESGIERMSPKTRSLEVKISSLRSYVNVTEINNMLKKQVAGETESIYFNAFVKDMDERNQTSRLEAAMLLAISGSKILADGGELTSDNDEVCLTVNEAIADLFNMNGAE